MSYKKAMRAAIEDAVNGAIADEARAAQRKVRQEARRQEREADAAVAAADPMGAVRERLTALDAQLADLKTRHQRHGDALAGRLVETLERERAKLLGKKV